MANKNTKQNRRAKEKSRKFGVAINSENGGKFRPKLTPDMQERVIEIKEQSRRIYG
jgi:hypothetical protein